jgi:hypothetical protein
VAMVAGDHHRAHIQIAGWAAAANGIDRNMVNFNSLPVPDPIASPNFLLRDL